MNPRDPFAPEPGNNPHQSYTGPLRENGSRPAYFSPQSFSRPEMDSSPRPAAPPERSYIPYPQSHYHPPTEQQHPVQAHTTANLRLTDMSSPHTGYAAPTPISPVAVFQPVSPLAHTSPVQNEFVPPAPIGSAYYADSPGIVEPATAFLQPLVQPEIVTKKS